MFTLLAALGAFLLRIETLKSRATLDSILSREAAFLAQNVLFLAVAFVTLWGTVYPVFTQAAQGQIITIGEPFFNRVNGPLLLVIVLLMGVGPLLPWRRATGRNAIHALRYPLIGAGLGAAALLAIGVRDPIPLVALAVVILDVVGILHEWWRGTLSRHRKGESYPVAWGRLLVANRPRYGGYIVHLAIAMLAIGVVASSFYAVQRDVVLAPGETAQLSGYTFEYTGFNETILADRDEVSATFNVSKDGRFVGEMEAQRAFYRNFRIGATRAGIRSTPLEDFYIVPSEFGENGRAVFRVYVNPLVWWMWASGFFFVVGTLFALSPRRQPTPIRLPVPGRAQLASA